jgi:CP family cyanate transporter-like MFS transporter
VPPRTAGPLYAGTSIVLLALALRLPISSLGVVLPDLREDLALSTTAAGALTALPVLCFAIVGLGAASSVARGGVRRAALLLLAALTAGLVVRATTSSVPVFVLGTVAVLSAIAVGNVLLPVLGKAYFPDRLPLISSLSGAAVIGGSGAGALGAGVAVGWLGWRVALGGAAAVSGAAAVCWLLLADHRAGSGVSDRRIALRAVARSRHAWLMVLCFGLLSAQAYAQMGWYPAILVDAGLGSRSAGVMFSVLTGAGIPTILALPWLMRVLGPGPTLPVLFGAATVAGWLGVLIAPATATWVWSVLIGFGAGVFAWALAMVGLHSRTAEGAAALSGFMQGIGYLVAAIGPFGVGLLHDLTDGWGASVWLLIATGLGIAVFGASVATGWHVEDDLSGPPREAGSGERNPGVVRA